MENTQDIKRRIQTVLNIKHVANAVKLVSSVKLSKLKQSILKNIVDSKNILQDMLSTIISELEFYNKLPETHILKLCENKKESLLIILSTNQGAFDNSVSDILSTIKQYNKLHSPTYIEIFGKKIPQTLQKGITTNNLKRDVDNVNKLTDNLSQLIKNYILNSNVGRIDIISSKLKNQVSSEIIVTNIMPIQKKDITSFNQFEFINPLHLLDTIFQQYIYDSCLNIAQDHILANLSVHVFTTDKIVRNSDNISKELKLLYNRTRQAKITQELTEIVASVESLR